MKTPFFPDWMFAAFAIGLWELFDQMWIRFHVPAARWIGGTLAGISIFVLVIRYGVRWLHRSKDIDPPDPNEWKNY